jgi:hypothetical protein
MSEAKRPTILQEHQTGDAGLRPFVYSCLIVAAVWISSGVIIYFVFEDWPTRGTVGDAFGAVNALFSGLALAGVIYALILQRRELILQRQELHTTRTVMSSQLEEMRSSRQLQSQPFCLPVVPHVDIERPCFFYSPHVNEYSAQSRYRIELGLRNPTQHPCIALRISAAIRLHVGGEDRDLSAPNEFVDCLLPADVINPGPSSPGIMFAGDSAGRFLDALTQPDRRHAPLVVIKIAYKNIAGGHFEVNQAFHVFPDPAQANAVAEWHTSIAGFEAKHRQALNHLKAMKATKDAAWNSAFEEVKTSFHQSLDANHNAIKLPCYAAAASFHVRQITCQEYERNLSPSCYPQEADIDMYDQPVAIDASTPGLSADSVR